MNTKQKLTPELYLENVLDFLNQFSKQKLHTQVVTELEKNKPNQNTNKKIPSQTLHSLPNLETLRKVVEIEHVVPVVS